MKEYKATGYEGKKCKNRTQNAPPDTHSEFCARCLKFNDGCPNGNKKACSL